MDNVFVKSLFDFLHLLATIAWFGTLFFAKHVLVAILALMAIINFEIITPKFQKIAASGPSPELEKKQTEL
jgi:putative copper export protein